MRIFESLLNPFSVPSWLTTFLELTSKASFRPLMISVLLKLPRDVCPVLPPRIVPSVSEFRIVPTLTPHPLFDADAPPWVTQLNRIVAATGNIRSFIFFMRYV